MVLFVKKGKRTTRKRKKERMKERKKITLTKTHRQKMLNSDDLIVKWHINFCGLFNIKLIFIEEQ